MRTAPFAEHTNHLMNEYLAIRSCGFLILHTPLFSSNVLITEYERHRDRLKALAVRLDICDLQKHKQADILAKYGIKLSEAHLQKVIFS